MIPNQGPKSHGGREKLPKHAAGSSTRQFRRHGRRGQIFSLFGLFLGVVPKNAIHRPASKVGGKKRGAKERMPL